LSNLNITIGSSNLLKWCLVIFLHFICFSLSVEKAG